MTTVMHALIGPYTIYPGIINWYKGVMGGHHFIFGGARFGGWSKIFCTMIQQMYFFSQLLSHQLFISVSLHLWFQLYLEGNYLFQQLAATNYLFYPSSCLKLFISPPPRACRLNAGPLTRPAQVVDYRSCTVRVELLRAGYTGCYA